MFRDVLAFPVLCYFFITILVLLHVGQLVQQRVMQYYSVFCLQNFAWSTQIYWLPIITGDQIELYRQVLYQNSIETQEKNIRVSCNNNSKTVFLQLNVSTLSL